MKKKLILAVALLLSLAATSAFAAYGTTLPGSPAIPGKLSTNVQLDYAVASDNSGYVAGTYHLKGTKSFGSSSGDSAVFASPNTAETLPSAPVGTASAGFSSPWAPL